MAVKPVNMNKLTPKHNARHIGAASGMLAGSAYILKNRKDIFVEAGKKAAAELGYTNKAVGIAVPAVVSTGIVAAATLAGTLVGAVIDKIRNNAMQKKMVLHSPTANEAE